MSLIEQLTEGMGDSYQIYCDLDGVLVAFEERFEHYTGLKPDEWKKRANKEFGEKIATNKFWDIIDNQVGMRFWAGASFYPQGKELWDYVKQYNPIILTAPSLHDSSVEGKTMWVKENLGDYEIIFRQAKDKSEFAGPNKILIDDSVDNISDWKRKNGIGLLYTGDTKQTILELQQYGI